MSVVARPRVLLLVGALAACGGDDGPTVTGPDAAPSLDAGSDAPPRGMVKLGSRGACPRELQADGDTLYWLEAEVLVRSNATTFSPEVVYTGVNGHSLQVAGGAAFWAGTWPVRLDLEPRVARPIITTAVSGLTVVDGGRPIVITDDTRIAEIEAGGVLRDLHTDRAGSLIALRHGGPWLFWTRLLSDGSAQLQWRDSVSGVYGAGLPAADIVAFASGEQLALVMRNEGGRPLLAPIRGGRLAEAQYLTFTPGKLAVAADSSIYTLEAGDKRLFHAEASPGGYVFDATSTVQRFDELAAVGDGAVVVDCSGPATYYRWYP